MTVGWAVLAACGAGLATSAGPCVAPRFLAAASLVTGVSGSRRWRRVGAFAGGVCASYLLIASTAGAIAQLSAHSEFLYGLLGAVFVVAGIATVVRAHDCAPRCPRAGSSCAAAFLAGATLGAVGSPCCAPLAAAAATAGFTTGSWVAGVAVPAAFALGHAAPLAAVAVAPAVTARFGVARVPEFAVATVAGGLTFALGSYYALLA
ncbi:MAG: hypothetical protein WB615_05755 [Candidatus Tumulicola sp.]